MHSRFLLALFTASALCGTAALAAPPVGVPPVAPPVAAPPAGVPPVQVPPAQVPPVNLPKPPAAPAAGVQSTQSTQARQTTAARANVLHGTIANISGTAVTVKLSDGTTQTYTVSSQTASRLQAQLHKTIAFRVQSGTFTYMGAGAPPLLGTVQSVNGTAATVKLNDGSTQTYSVTAQQAAFLKAHAGKRVSFWANANGSIELNQSSHASGSTHKQCACKKANAKPARSGGHIH